MSSGGLGRVEDAARLYARAGVERRIVCPNCNEERRHHRGEPTLSITLSSDGLALYHCWHCEAKGGAKMQVDDFELPEAYAAKSAPITIPRTNGHALTPKAKEYLTQERKLSYETISRFQVYSDVQQFRVQGGFQEEACIAFPYIGEDGQAYAIKYRSASKHFKQEGSCRTFWGLDRLPKEGLTELVVTEGEVDCLSFVEAGAANAVSCPSGAPLPRSDGLPPLDSGGKRFAYLEASRALLKQVRKIYLATDADPAGEGLANELARRIGMAKCWKVSYPDGCKDANDVLVKHGPEAVQRLLKEAKPWPVEGVYRPMQYRDDILQLYQGNAPKGVSTGLKSVDELFTLMPGQVIIMTGLPGAGKSEFTDALMVNTAMQQGWNWGVWSYENPPSMHIPKLAEKYMQTPFYGERRMTEGELNQALAWVDEHFAIIEAGDGQAATIDFILDCGEVAVLRWGIRGLVIDPYNYIAKGARDESETDYISSMLTKVRAFARNHGVCVIFVAHPKKLETTGGELRAPNGNDISGSAAWWSKADVGATVHRAEDLITRIITWKVRFKWVGRIGETMLNYNLDVGSYHEVDEFAFP